MEEGPQRKLPVVLIPAYQPDGRLVGLVRRLREFFSRVILVDDGSTVGLDAIAEADGLVEKTIVLPVNCGKGAALKAGFEYLLSHGGPVDVITADADGQHTPEDILRVADAMSRCPEGLTLGVRSFAGRVPLRSRFGNLLTRTLFFLMTGMALRDTQTGLRGIPASLLARVAAIPGERYEYEMAMLADARRHPSRPLQVSIKTVYESGNKTSHFKPVLDAFRIYRSLFQFCLSSVLGFLVDNTIFAFVIWLLAERDTARREDILFALVLARLVSANCNFLYNRFVVFRGPAGKTGFLRYWALVLVIAACSYGLTDALAEAFDVSGFPITMLKIAVDTFLFFASYFVQKRFVFR